MVKCYAATSNILPLSPIVHFRLPRTRLLSVNSAINRELRKTSSDRRYAPPVRKHRENIENNDRQGGKGSSRSHGSSYDEARRTHHGSARPLEIPYSTASSEFLYGSSVVQAALHAQRRRLYKLYIYDGDNRARSEEDFTIRRLALKSQTVVDRVKNDRHRLMDKLSDNRPHNV